jgi:mycofactocin biosynthesis protein MftB
MPEAPAATGTAGIDLDVGWKLHPQVALRPEPFGALLYHFGTRKLSFLKNRKIVAVVEALPDHSDARSALRAQGIGDDTAPQYARALGTLAESHMIVPA